MNVDNALWALIALALTTSAFVDLRVVHGDLDVPIADLAGMLLAGLFGIVALVRVGPTDLFGASRPGPAGQDASPDAPIAFPAARWYALFLVACTASWWRNGFDPQSAHFLARKPLFDYVVYGGGVAGAVAALRRPERMHAISLVYVGLTSLLCIPVALNMLIHGWISAIDRVPGLINNHKVFAVAVSPYVPALFLWRKEATGRLRDATNVVLVLAIVAIVVSISRTAWIAVAFGLVGFAKFGGKRAIERPLAMAVVTGALFAAMTAIPFVTGAAYMTDAFDSRMSLNLRVVQMLQYSPWVGAGPGMSVRWLMVTAPHWRINGVDAHGAIQKVVSEFGVFGLVAYLGFVASVVIGAWRGSFATGARPNGYTLGATALVLGLHVNLLLSTEYFSASHWMPLAVGLGMLRSGHHIGLGELAPRLPADEADGDDDHDRERDAVSGEHLLEDLEVSAQMPPEEQQEGVPQGAADGRPEDHLA